MIQECGPWMHQEVIKSLSKYLHASPPIDKVCHIALWKTKNPKRVIFWYGSDRPPIFRKYMRKRKKNVGNVNEEGNS